MSKISAVIITKNEELNIERCIQSLIRVVDEIIIVDSYSTDNTPKICQKYPQVRFFQTDWKGFSETKNYGNQLASFEFILSLDADEELSTMLQDEILNIKNQLKENEAYYINRITNYCGKWIYHSGWLPDYQLRLFPKKDSHWNKAQVHEHIEFTNEMTIKKLSGLLNHYSYYTINEHIDRMKSYTSLGAEKVLAKNENFLLIKATVNPFLRFFKSYFLKLGILDGAYGFAISIMASFTVFLKYFKAWQSRKYNKTP
ncbi:MAG: glycosyltransferase family 2 protein [Bdellovibrionaceae bacterium]|nr:glycosyltransferase family 2 protein [Pseudobdellovibrionaceae bacterium]